MAKIISEKKGAETWPYGKKKYSQNHLRSIIESRIGNLRRLWKQEYHVDLDNLVQPLLFRILSSYLDQGIAIWDFPIGQMGFLDSLRKLEKESFSSFF